MAVEQRMQQEGPLNRAQQEWLAWANRIADEMDPVKMMTEQDMSGWETDNPLQHALKQTTSFDLVSLKAFETTYSTE